MTVAVQDRPREARRSARAGRCSGGTHVTGALEADAAMQVLACVCGAVTVTLVRIPNGDLYASVTR